MSMLFDRFANRRDAEAFAAAVQEQFGRRTAIYDTQEASDIADPFPFRLRPPVVHVERTFDAEETAVADFVLFFGGEFAGT